MPGAWRCRGRQARNPWRERGLWRHAAPGGVIIGFMTTTYPSIEQTVSNTPLVRLQGIPDAV
ncbi:hypothetical protein, partial [Achromobacter insuavis]|uniref:hypothetical protein n=1 Tax=Achromobacter insuavis TaxID=1287735 RepID=UPI0035A01B64